MRQMGLEAIYRKPNLSRPQAGHHLSVSAAGPRHHTRPNPVWATDITYVSVRGGYAYLCAVVDWHTRYVLAWELSNPLDASFCVRAVERAIASHGTPEISSSPRAQRLQYCARCLGVELGCANICITAGIQGRWLSEPSFSKPRVLCACATRLALVMGFWRHFWPRVTARRRSSKVAVWQSGSLGSRLQPYPIQDPIGAIARCFS